MPSLSARAVFAFVFTILATIIAPSSALPTSEADISTLFTRHIPEAIHHRNFIAKSDCTAKVENTPWILSNIAVINTTNPDGLGSSICFNFFDSNAGLQMATVCELTRTAETMAANQNGYFPCIDKTVSFSVDWESLSTIKVLRRYQDPCLGKPPYDRGTFFGSGKLDFTAPIATVDGKYMTQARLEVPITSQD